MWVSEVVEDIKPVEDLVTPVKLGLVVCLLIAVGYVVESEVMPGLAALGRVGLPRGQHVHGYQGGGDVQVEPGGSCLLHELENQGVIANYIGTEPAVASSDMLEFHNVGLWDDTGGEDAIAKLLDVENSITAMLEVQLYAEDLMPEVGVLKSVISHLEVSMYDVNYL